MNGTDILMVGVCILIGGLVVLGMLGAALSPVLGIAGGYLNIGTKTISADNWERNYEWFKIQETAMNQVLNQACVINSDMGDLEVMYGPPTAWTKTTKDSYDTMAFEKRGYVSKYNQLVAEYNARRASFIRDFGRDPRMPGEFAPYYDATCERWQEAVLQ